MGVRNEIRFLLNDEEIRLKDLSPDLSLLDYLRLDKDLIGTKEGCNEGDCGACTILVGKLVFGELIYESVNACIRFVPSLDLCHIVTIEHLKKNDVLHPIQQAMVKYHGSQCGFCTPGIIMSLYALLLKNPNANRNEIEKALQGNLCRCTGYAPIIKVALSLSEKGGLQNDILLKQREEIEQKLKNMSAGNRVEINSEKGEFFIPKDIADLVLLLEQNPNATILAGSSDIGLWVNVAHKDISPIIFIANLSELRNISQTAKGIEFGACVTYSESYEIIAKHFPHLSDFWAQIGGNQIRNMGTLGGNIANGSPIGDLAPAFIALGAKLNLVKGKTERTILLEDFYIAYAKQDLQKGEFIKSIFIPFIKENEKHAIYKISKRKYEDISTICAAFKLEIKNKKITKAIFAFGGMAAKPSRAYGAEKVLEGKLFNEENIKKASMELPNDFAPIDDVRSSAQYRMLLAQNLLYKFFTEQKHEQKNEQ